MSKIGDLPQAEFDVMNILWSKGEATVKELVAAYSEEKRPAYTTVATLLKRLRDRGYVEAIERNFAYVFRPLVPREQVVKRKLDDLVQRVLDGHLSPLAAYIAEKKKLTPEQIQVLEEMLGSNDEDHDNGS